MNNEVSIMIFSLLSALLYIAAATLYIIAKGKKLYAVFGVLAGISNAIVFFIHWSANGYPPFANIYQLLCVLSFIFFLLFALFLGFGKNKLWLTPYLLYAAAIPLIGTLFMENTVEWTLVPALRSPYFVPHVFVYMLSYCLAAISFILCIEYVIFKSKRDTLYDAVLLFVRISVPFMVAGLTLGAIWADQIWGNFWSWDVKEIWSLITCMLYLCGLHSNSVKNKFLAVVFFILGFVSLVVTFLFVNVLPSAGSMHTYS